MKIRKIKIKGYKVFDDIELDFTDSEGKTLDTIVLAGVNGSGKTTILELIKSLFWFYEGNFKYEWEERVIHNSVYFPFIDGGEIELQIDAPEYSLIESLNYLFAGLRRDLRKSASKNPNDAIFLKTFDSFNTQFQNYFDNYLDSKPKFFTFVYKAKIENNRRFQEQNDFSVLESFIFGSPKIFYFPANTYLHKGNQTDNHEDIEASIRKQDIGFVREIDFDLHKVATEKYLVNPIIQKILTNRNIATKKIIKEATTEINAYLSHLHLNTKFIDITSEEEPKAVFQSFNGQKIGIDDLSNGEKQLFYRAVYLKNLNINNAIIMVDEAENSLHPTWQQEILKLYQNIGQNNQVILATHSPHIIASVKPEQLFVLVPNEKKSKIETINMAKAHQNTKGLEPNRILSEIMGTPLRDYETQQKINQVTENLTEENFEREEIQVLIEQLTEDLGRQDPFIMKVNHQLTMFKRKKLQSAI